MNILTFKDYQGSGKTYFTIYTMERLFKNKVIFTNIKTYHSTRNIVKYFDVRKKGEKNEYISF